jgi:hypothetical protein
MEPELNTTNELENTIETTEAGTAELPIVNEWDSVIIQINSKGEGCGAISMERQDIEGLMDLHSEGRGRILDMMLKALETTPKENFVQKN